MKQNNDSNKSFSPDLCANEISVCQVQPYWQQNEASVKYSTVHVSLFSNL